jgi:hypothetical protein
MSISWLRRSGLMLISACLATACGASKKIDVGGTCLLNSDCNGSLVCTMGKCHDACHTSADCPAGEPCTKVNNSPVCLVPAEAHCTANVPCGPLLICAADLRCRSDCSAGCLAGQLCVQGVCTWSDELGSDAGAYDVPSLDLSGPDTPADGPSTPTCGTLGATCCAGSTCSATDMACSPTFGICVKCGIAVDLPCCAGDICSAAGTVCATGTCKSCGGSNQPCCAGDVCNGVSSLCSSGSCVACGSAGKPCCSGGKCSGAYAACESGVCCGVSGGPCCAGEACNDLMSVCSAGTCVPCGMPNQRCCAGETCQFAARPGSASACVAGTCQPTL